MTPPVSYRPARPDDIVQCTRIWSAGIEDYIRRLNQPWFTGDPEPLQRLLAHFLATDPGLFWVATAPGRGAPTNTAALTTAAADDVIAFGSANRRGHLWFLGMLFVLPAFQGRGVGRALLERLLPPLAEQAAGAVTLGTATDSVQPISNALYSQFGMIPRLPVFNLVGDPRNRDALAPLPSGIHALESAPGRADDTRSGELTAESDAIAAIDAQILGFDHRADHGFLRAEGRRRFLFRDRDDRLVGYGYIAPSGRIGPAAALDADLLAPIVAHLIATVRPPGAYSTWITGASGPVFGMLLAAGLRFESFPALVLWNRPIADFTRYVPNNLALL